MRDRIFFFFISALAALTISPIVAGIAVLVGNLAGMSDSALVVLFGSTTAGIFVALMILASLAASLFFSAKAK